MITATSPHRSVQFIISTVHKLDIALSTVNTVLNYCVALNSVNTIVLLSTNWLIIGRYRLLQISKYTCNHVLISTPVITSYPYCLNASFICALTVSSSKVCTKLLAIHGHLSVFQCCLVNRTLVLINCYIADQCMPWFSHFFTRFENNYHY